MSEQGERPEPIAFDSLGKNQAEIKRMSAELSLERGYKNGDLVIWQGVVYVYEGEADGKAIITIPQEGRASGSLDDAVGPGTWQVPFEEISHVDIRGDMENIGDTKI